MKLGEEGLGSCSAAGDPPGRFKPGSGQSLAVGHGTGRESFEGKTRHLVEWWTGPVAESSSREFL